MMLRWFAAGVLVVLSGTANAAEDVVAQISIPEEISAYAKAYHAAQTATEPQSIEPLYQLGEQARAAFFAANSETLIAKIMWGDKEPRARFEQKMAQQVPGYGVSSGAESLHYDVDAKAFLQLAEQHGTEADRVFFKLHEVSFRYGNWPVYIEPQTDITGCVTYGSAEYVDFYKQWNAFLKAHPQGFYAERAKDYLSDFHVAHRCSCDSKEDTIRGLENLTKITTDTALKKTIVEEIHKRKTTPVEPALKPGRAVKGYGYNGELCGG